MPARTLSTSLLVAIIYLIASPLSQATVVWHEARVSQIVNDVKKIDSSKGPRPAVLNETLNSDTSVRTGLQSRSELVFPDNTVTRLGANTEFNFTGGTRDMHLDTGTMLLQVPKNAGGAKITTAAVTAAITGTTVMWETIRPHSTGKHKCSCGLHCKCQAGRMEPSCKGMCPFRAQSQYVKFIVLEGTARLYLNNKPFESITVHEGQMVILPVQPLTLNNVEPVSINVQQLVVTSALITELVIDRRVTPFSLGLVDETISHQDKKFRDGRLTETNLVMNGSGTDVLLTTDHSRTAQKTFGNNQGSGSNGQTSSPSLPTYTGNFTVNDTTNVVTDPTIQTGGVTHTGAIFRSTSLDGSLTGFLGDVTSPFLEAQIESRVEPGPSLAVFKFNNLIVQNAPASVDTNNQGPDSVLLAAVQNVSFTGLPNPNNGGLPDPANVDFKAIPFTIIALQGSIDSAPSSEVHGDHLRLLAAQNFNAAAGSFFTLDSVAAGQDIRVGNNTEVLSSGLAPVAGRDINLANASYLVQTMTGKVSAGRDITLGEGSHILFSPTDATASGVSTIFAKRDVQLGDFAEVTRDPDSTGLGGNLEVVSAKGTISLNQAKIEASGSAQAGQIKLHGGRTTDTAITITNSSQLLVLLNAAPPTAKGGRIEVTSAGGSINISGGSTIQADKGTVDVHNSGASGAVVIDGATLAGDVVKAGALGANGTLTIRTGSQLSAVSALKLYGGSSNGSVLFTGGGNITLNGSQIDIAAFKVQVDNGTTVHNNGTTDIYANTHNYSAPNLPSSTFGSFTNPVGKHNGASSAPGF